MTENVQKYIENTKKLVEITMRCPESEDMSDLLAEMDKQLDMLDAEDKVYLDSLKKREMNCENVRH